MSPERFNQLIDHCFAEQIRNGGTPRYEAVAEFFGVEVRTLQRWRSGSTPIPHAVSLVMAAHTIAPDAVDKAPEVLAEWRRLDQAK